MARIWQLQEAKNSFSEVVDLAMDEGPQTVTRHGRAVAVVVSKEEFDKRRRPKGPRGSILAFLRGLHFTGAALDLERAKDVDRDLEL